MERSIVLKMTRMGNCKVIMVEHCTFAIVVCIPGPN